MKILKLANSCTREISLLPSFPKKLLQIRRDLIESFLEHILKFSGSKSESQNFSSQISDKSEFLGGFQDFALRSWSGLGGLWSRLDFPGDALAC